jgi:hypothetical protein
VKHPAKVPEPIRGIVAILKDFLPGSGTVEAKKIVQVTGARTQVGGVARLGCFSNDDRRQKEQILVSKEVKPLSPVQQLLVEERIVVRLPVDLCHVKIRRNAFSDSLPFKL